MTLSYYFDQHMPRPIARGMRRRTIDVLTTEADGRPQGEDEALLERARELGRVFVTQDDDFLTIVHRWREEGRHFAGLVFVRDPMRAIGRVMEDLELIAHAYESEEIVDQILYIPF